MLGSEYAAQKKRYLKSRKMLDQRHRAGGGGGAVDDSGDSEAEDKTRPLTQKFRLHRPQLLGKFKRRSSELSGGGGGAAAGTPAGPSKRGRKPKSYHAAAAEQQHNHRRHSAIHPGNEFGSSAFDYDASLMDLGMPQLQNVDYQEITVPQ